MGNHPVNLTLRFVLEMSALFSVAYWGWHDHQGTTRYLTMVGLPVLFAVIWGVFAVPGDPSRSGKTVVKTAGWLRLTLELLLFGTAILTFYLSDLTTIAEVFGILVILHYLVSFDRVKWLLGQ
jgi:hypothetical protein